jgi:hypothetical protein
MIRLAKMSVVTHPVGDFHATGVAGNRTSHRLVGPPRRPARRDVLQQLISTRGGEIIFRGRHTDVRSLVSH